MKIDFGWAHVELFPSAPYSICGASPAYILGLALERQRGVHAIASDRRGDFDAWPGDFACTAPEVEIYSESAGGGEYLAMHIARDTPGALPQDLMAAPRMVLRGSRQAVQLGWRLRLLMNAPVPDHQLVEEQLAQFLECGLSHLNRKPSRTGRYDADRMAHGRVLEYIDAGLDRPIGLQELADLAQMPLLRFLRSFTQAVGATPHAYLTERRVQRARALLASTDATVAAIAADCGFAHQSRLGAVFKARLGVTPQQYRSRQR